MINRLEGDFTLCPYVLLPSRDGTLWDFFFLLLEILDLVLSALNMTKKSEEFGQVLHTVLIICCCGDSEGYQLHSLSTWGGKLAMAQHPLSTIR